MSADEVVFHSAVRPEVGPDRYFLDSTQSFSGAQAPVDTVEQRRHDIEVTGPRFSLPGPEIFGVFPPPNSQGPFAGRLAQIVLKRRTLPWERSGSNGPPWLALVVLADGEATLLSNVEVRHAYSSGVSGSLTGLPTGVRCDAIEVTQTVIDKAFPAEEELMLLAHAREVDPSDTEFADDDGWVSVVLSNRLPQPGTAYGCYLISLEGQLDVLPDPGRAVSRPNQIGAFDHLALDERPLLRQVSENVAVDHDGIVLRPGTVAAGVAESTTSGVFAVTSTGSAFVVDDARELRNDGQPVAVIGARTGFVRQDLDLARIGDILPLEPRTRFPVLAQWSFEAADMPGDFKAYLENIDVAMLGDTRPPEDDPRARRPETTATGHVALSHTDRRGRTGRAWYRGACSPVKVTREPAGQPYHVADQARRVGADGREELSYAGAFEVGRLLAMSDLQFLRDLRTWARAAFARQLEIDLVRPVLDAIRSDLELAHELSRTLAIEALAPGGIGGDPRVHLGQSLPLHDAEVLTSPDDVAVLAGGLGSPRRVVLDLLAPGISTTPTAPADIERPDGPRFDDVLAGDAGSVEAALDGVVARRQAEWKRVGELVSEHPDGLLGSIFGERS